MNWENKANSVKLEVELGKTSVINYFKWRRPPMEDDLKILKGEYLSNLLLGPTHILNSSLDYQK